MTDERFEELMRDAAQSYNAPPATPPFNEMWQNIEQQLGDAKPLRIEPHKRGLFPKHWLMMAAMLILGLALGRASSMLFPTAHNPLAGDLADSMQSNGTTSYDSATGEYLGQAAAMLVALPGELRSRHPDSGFFTRLDDLLQQTRLLMDSPAGEDPALHNLLEDLEVVLIQVVRLQSDRDPIKIELLNEALEQRDVMPRLRDAVVSHIGD